MSHLPSAAIKRLDSCSPCMQTLLSLFSFWFANFVYSPGSVNQKYWFLVRFVECYKQYLFAWRERPTSSDRECWDFFRLSLACVVCGFYDILSLGHFFSFVLVLIKVLFYCVYFILLRDSLFFLCLCLILAPRYPPANIQILVREHMSWNKVPWDFCDESKRLIWICLMDPKEHEKSCRQICDLHRASLRGVQNVTYIPQHGNEAGY